MKEMLRMIWPLLVLIGISWLLQSFFGYLQIKHFNRKYSELRALGRVAIGKKTALFKAGTVVMFAIDKEDRILKASKMQGTTIFSRVKDMKGFEGKALLQLKNDPLEQQHKLTKLAIYDALNSYDVISQGGELKVKKGWIDYLIPKKIKA